MFELGIRQCHLQPCQKQESRKTTTRADEKTKSGLPNNRSPDFGLKPASRRAFLNSISSPVSFDRILDITALR